MDCMGKGSRLHGHVADEGIFLREIIRDSPRGSQNQNAKANRNLEGDPVCPLRKKVGHESPRKQTAGGLSKMHPPDWQEVNSL